MQAEEPALEKLLEAEDRRVEGYANRLRMSRLAVVRVLISWVLEVPARIANFGIDHPGNIAKDVFDAPKAAAGEHRNLKLLLDRFNLFLVHQFNTSHAYLLLSSFGRLP